MTIDTYVNSSDRTIKEKNFKSFIPPTVFENIHSALPQVEISWDIFATAIDYGIRSGYGKLNLNLNSSLDELMASSKLVVINYDARTRTTSLASPLDSEPSLENGFMASAALTIMEETHRYHRVEKVWLFARNYAYPIIQSLDSLLQKIEFTIRLGKLMDRWEMPQYIDLAEDLLSQLPEGTSCSRHLLIDLAFLYVKEYDAVKAVYWLKRADAEKKHYLKAVESFFREGLFKEGLNLLNQSPKDFETDQNLSFVEIVGENLKKDGKVELNFSDHYLKNLSQIQSIIILRALCYKGKIEEAYELSKRMAIIQDLIWPLIQVCEYIQDKNELSKKIHDIRTLALNVSHRSATVSCLLRSKLFTVSEDIVTAAVLLDNPYEKEHVLWERACGISIMKEKTPEDYADLELILRAIVEVLLDERYEYRGQWCKVQEMCIQHGLIELALDLGLEWKKIQNISHKGNIGSELWFMTTQGMLLICTGKRNKGLALIQEAYALEKGKEERVPKNSCEHYIRSAIDDMIRSPMLEGLPAKNTLKKIKMIPFQTLEYNSFKSFISNNLIENNK